MKITHSSGQEYHLSPETKLELTRYNPFFHDMGEQSIPISLPASDHNLALLKHPESTAGRDKIASRVDATIQSGIYSVNARQAILSAQRNGTIETSFYLREGAFYEKIKDISLQEIFEDKKIEFANITAALNFMHSLITTNDSRFACFQVITDNYILNQRTTRSGHEAGGFFKFEKEYDTTETIDGNEITVPKGFYITPFIKVKHLLEEVLAYFDYTLAPSFLDNAPFADMCFLNNNIDTIVDNRIDYVSIVPNITVSELLEILRKFNLEFVPDEQKGVIKIVFFDDLINSTASEDITANVADTLKVNYAEYKQIKLSSDRLSLPSSTPFDRQRHEVTKTASNANTENSSFIDMLAQNPTAYLRKTDGAVVRDVVKGTMLFQEVVGNLSFDYHAGGTLSTDEKNFPDVVPAVFLHLVTFPYVGAGRALNSSIVLSNETTDSTNDMSKKADTSTLLPMLCFTYSDSVYRFQIGTLSNVGYRGQTLWGYSLMYNGANGIYEKFWRNRDNLLRNAMIEVEADLLLSEKQKFTLSTMEKVLIDGQELFFSEMKYTPEMQQVEPCKLLTTKLQLPLSVAKTETDYLPARTYRWGISRATQSWTWPPGRPSGTYGYKYLSDPVPFYPPEPTQAQYNAGGKHYQKTYSVEYGEFGRDNVFTKYGDGTITVWLIAELAP